MSHVCAQSFGGGNIGRASAITERVSLWSDATALKWSNMRLDEGVECHGFDPLCVGAPDNRAPDRQWA